MRTRGVPDHLARSKRSGLRKSTDQGSKGVVWNGDEHQVDVCRNLVRCAYPGSGEQPFDAGDAGGGHARRGDHPVAGVGQCGAKHGANPTRTDDANPQMTSG